VKEAFGVGDGVTLWYMDMIGVQMAMIKALKARVEALELHVRYPKQYTSHFNIPEETKANGSVNLG